jgi:hypothetical protein
VDTTKYAGFAAVFDTMMGDGGNENGGVLVQPVDYNVTFLAHETGHIFGLDHSFDQSDRKVETWSSPGEYWDQYDIMSAKHVYSSHHPPFGPRGPRLNVANLDRMGLYLEFRTKEAWDAGIPEATVLIHDLQGVNTVIIASNKANWDDEWLPGHMYGPSDLELAIKGGTRIKIESFDLNAKKARINVIQQAGVPSEVGPAVLFGGATAGGDGWMILPSGVIARIPPRSPFVAVMNQIAAITEAERRLSPTARATAVRALYADLIQTVERAARGPV